MKKLFILLLAITGCAKPPAPGSTFVSKSSTAALSAFNDTRQEAEENLLKTAAVALRAGITLDSARAERCWREEESRPLVRESCVLLWAGNGQNSAALEDALISGRSRVLAIALLQRRALIARKSYPDLLALLDTLAKDALWTKTELALAWLESRGHPGLAESEALLSRVRPTDNSGPRDIASSLKAIRALRAGAWQESLSTYCDSAAAGESRLRCWKVLGALGSSAANLHHLLPSVQDEDWTLFTRSFPRQAEKLRPFLR